MHTNDVWNQTIDKISKKSNNEQYDAAESQRQRRVVEERRVQCQEGGL